MADASFLSIAGVTPVAHRSDVLARLSADASVLKAIGLARCAAFGSFTRDQAIRPNSDVDLLTTEGLSRHLAASVLGEVLDLAVVTSKVEELDRVVRSCLEQIEKN